ncbi:MAG: DNA internalization-related competence protein ComEC/Rec2 [Desulfobulbaceae bacterium]|nr:DNA internalization-related competence protein ComEC/Rec2 [Desulfobulbaceae bacterium]
MRFSISSAKEYIQLNIIVPVAISYIAGASLAGTLLPGNALLGYISGLAVILTAGVFVFRKHSAALACTLPLFLLLGFIHTGHAFHPPDSPDHVYNLITAKSKVTLTGTVTGMPEYDGHTTRMEMEADTILFHQPKKAISEQIRATGRIRISIDGQLPDTIFPGDHLLAIASLNRATNYQTPGVFNYRLYLANRSIFVTGKIHSPTEIMPYTDLSEPWYRKVLLYPESIRYSVGIFLENNLDPELAGLYKALLIGSRAGISDPILESFKATGCMHLLAISGIHMGLLGMIIAFAFSWGMKHSSYLLNHLHVPTAATLLSLPLLFGYAFIAGMNTPVLRALIMSVFFLLGVVLRRQRSIIHIIAAAALLLLMIKPLALFTVSFQLSFSSVLAIALIYPRLILLLDQQNSTTWSKIYTYTGAALFISIAATLGSLPFMLLHFNRFSPVGPLMNLLVEPLLCLWALPIGLVALPLTLLSPELAGLLLKIGSFGITAAVKTTSLGSQIPFASLWSITPASLEIILYYGILLLWFYRASVPGHNRSAIMISVLFILYFTRGLWLSFPGKITEISSLDIGQGSSTFIRLPHGRTILLDGGNNSSPSFNAGESIIAPFLRKKQVWQLDDIIISHPHSDHYNGLSFIIRRFKPKRLWINGNETESWPYSDLLLEASRSGAHIIKPEKAAVDISDQEAHLTGLHNYLLNKEMEKKGNTFSVNDLSLVLRLEHGDFTFLFPGDISMKMEEILIEQGAHLQADVLLAPHHGSKGSGSKAFLSAVDPEIIVVSAGKNSQGRYPSQEHLKEWNDNGRAVLETSRDGTITFVTDGSDLQIKTSVRPSEFEPDDCKKN